MAKFNEEAFIKEFEKELVFWSNRGMMNGYNVVRLDNVVTPALLRLHYSKKANQSLVNEAINKWYDTLKLVKKDSIQKRFKNHSIYPSRSMGFGYCMLKGNYGLFSVKKLSNEKE